MAAAFIEADLSALERGALIAGRVDAGDVGLLGELRQLEDRFGLSPLARRRLQWELDQATARVKAPPKTERRDTRLHAVS